MCILSREGALDAADPNLADDLPAKGASLESPGKPISANSPGDLSDESKPAGSH
jgi:hypothetical protein